jgi:hypothetical protein
VSGYTVVFDSVYHGTLCGRWPTLPVWLTILPMADKHGHIDLTHQAISALTGWPIELLKQAINELMQPDPESRSEAHEGRRLVLIDPENRSWGWQVVNHERYREKARKAAYDADRTSSGKDKERKAAERQVSRDVPRDPAMSRPVPLSDSDSDANTDSNKEKNSESSASPPSRPPVEQVFQHWQQEWGHPKAQLDAKRRRLIDARLKDFTVAQLCDALSGYRHSAWHNGTDPKGNGVVYDGLQTLLQDSAHVETGLRLFAHPPRPPPKVEQLSAGDRVAQAYGANGNGSSRVVAEYGQNRGDVEDSGRDVWPTLPARLRG